MSKRILIADDEAHVVFILFEFLTGEGYEVSIVRTGKELYTLLSGSYEYYDLVISDVLMPEGEGIESVEMAQIFGSEIPVIYMTGFSDISLENDLILSKPLNLSYLLEKIKELTE